MVYFGYILYLILNMYTNSTTLNYAQTEIHQILEAQMHGFAF
jgi:hypothetical protein